MSRLDGADEPYWRGLESGKLMLPQCTGCHRWMWPAGHRCGSCRTVGLYWTERPMKATTFSWTRTWHSFGLTEAIDLPFTTVVAKIEDCGIRLLGRLDDAERIDPVPGERLIGKPGITCVGDDNIPTIIWSRAT